MNSMKIGTYQMDTSFGLYLPEYTIPAPTPQTNFVQIIGRDGSVDLSEAIGLHYDSRVWDLDFKCFDPTVNWHTLTSQVMNAIHGKRLNFEFDDDPNYFWTGRISVSSYVSTRGTGTLKVNITSDPFKYAKLSTIVTKNASTGTDYTGALVSFNTANAKINDLSVTIEPIQQGTGDPSPTNVRPITGLTGLNVYVSPTQDPDDATVYNVEWTAQAGTVYGGTLDVVTGQLTVTHASIEYDGSSDESWTVYSAPRFYINRADFTAPGNSVVADIKTNRLQVIAKQAMGSTNYRFSASDSGSHQFMIRVDSSVNTVALLRTWLSNNPLQVVYKLTTPLTYQLTPQEVATLTGQNNVWSDSGGVSVTVVTPETVTNNGRAVVPTLTASADMVLKWGNYSASVQQGTSTVPQLILENGANLIYIIGTGTLSFTWQEASL